MTERERSRPSSARPAGLEPAKIWIIVAAFNEGPVIGGVIRELRSLYPNIVVIDDGSADDTYLQLQASGATVIRHAVNLGQGAALRTGIDYALSRGAQILVTFDGDGQHAAADIERLVSQLIAAQADIALGSRFLAREPQVPAARRLLLRAAILFTRIVSGVRLTDAHNGLRAMRAAAARALDLSQPRMAHASEIVNGIVKHGLRFVEVPVNVTYSVRSRRKGQATLDSLNIVFDLLVHRLLR